jgi:hypothetical protein
MKILPQSLKCGAGRFYVAASLAVNDALFHVPNYFIFYNLGRSPRRVPVGGGREGGGGVPGLKRCGPDMVITNMVITNMVITDMVITNLTGSCFAPLILIRLLLILLGALAFAPSVPNDGAVTASAKAAPRLGGLLSAGGG